MENTDYHPTEIPTLTTTDWNEEWKALQRARRKADDPQYWNNRSKTYPNKRKGSEYVNRFIHLAEIGPQESVFDMGCGNGALSIPLALDGHEVIAADFSEGMLNILKRDSLEYGELPIKTKLLSWEDDWKKAGIADDMIDIAIASRSIVTQDLKDSLIKLTDVARRRCCITLPTGSSPRVDEQIMQEIGVANESGKDFVYAIMILIELGYLPSVQYISSKRFDTYEDFDDAFDNLKKMIVDPSYEYLTSDEQADAINNLETWLHKNLIKNPNAGKTDDHGLREKEYILKNPRTTNWAFIAWDKQS